VDVSVLKDLSLSKRTTIDDVAKKLGVSKNKVHKLKKEGVITRVSSTLKPHLREQNKKDRLKWCLFMLEPASIPHDAIFKGLFDFVFIDEKWFNMTRKTERYYTVPGEEVPTRTYRNQNYIKKIMFLKALARPRFNSDRNCTFDGKIRCFPFVTYEPAKRSSVNHPAGTIEMKTIGSIKKKEMREFMIEKVLPAIGVKWLAEDSHKPIYIEQDNATPHIAPTDRFFL
jgi:DNA-binding Lrp family transcriptional regulator